MPQTTNLLRRPTASFALLLGLWLSASVLLAGAPALDSVLPERQRVHEMIVLRGQGFLAYDVGVSRVVFETPDGALQIEAGRPYVWRDDYIKIRVPAGDGDQAMPITEMRARVVNSAGASNTRQFQLITRPNGVLRFVERTRIVGNEDVSGFLGTVARNKARTKDADIGDVDGDGYPDLIDNNSNNRDNDTHAVLHINRGDGSGFVSADWEPVDSGDSGSFVVTVPPGGDYVGNSIVYDADFVELNNDGLVDWVQAESGASLRLRVITNNDGGVPGAFLEDTDTWLPNQNPPGSPDDICHTDVDYDGFIDVATSYRFSNAIDLFLNDGGTAFQSQIRVNDPGSASLHDVFFIDANDDGHADMIGANENGGSPLFLNNGTPTPTFSWDQDFLDDAHSGIAADWNGDGLEDFALSEFNSASAYINNPANPGNFARVVMPNAVAFVYDLEAGDVNLDAAIDAVGASVTTAGDDAARIWINNGDGSSWSTWNNTSDILPGIGNYQRLSADLIDYDLDGDLDLYLTGSDGTGPWGFGASPNQFWENLLLGQRLDISGSCPGDITIRISAATPNSTVILLGSQALGAMGLPGQCDGTTLDLEAARILTTLQVDENGERVLQANVGEAVCDFHLQVVEAPSCSVSNFASVP